ncbi:hypothetical protein NADFUDRAFT_24114 [Nadsonia fulvescens var. elongata DSM 6958]|uniref:Elongation of fatty acids protein n=1 Tax=Nadsonia fulvescens var. elongata DSM 6958 TaxID=857566 RepID=A0A1E3PM11_9ASCO|nr:hypothetical protein NADFUDRAFT_24114 [Nadsonia fulvescens var. elongata DSM 6958]
MDARVPITIATAYAVLVHIANRYRKINSEPLSITKSKFFKAFVLIHNIGLCVYSAWTFGGMIRVFYKSIFETSKLLGPVWNSSSKYAIWSSICNLNDGIWGTGLQYYGYYFYLSKFYEVFDTIIILAKGKKSSLLQTYHHSGAMISMWLGIRYSSPPIWIFVVFNSLIHTLMYLYYTLSALKLKIPTALKRALTTAQIIQFVFGGSLGLLHTFVNYIDPRTGELEYCINTPGQNTALIFIIGYLAPLTYLFVTFFIESYLKKSRASNRRKNERKQDTNSSTLSTSTGVNEETKSVRSRTT